MFYLHFDLLLVELKRFVNGLKRNPKETQARLIKTGDQIAELSGEFAKYLYRD
jgi:hypothetical protein